MQSNLKQRISPCIWDKRFLTGLLWINIIGSLYGYYWYWEQLAATNRFLLLFVPDSPLSTTLFALVIFLKLRNKHIFLLPLLASSFLVKYGLWAVGINLHLLFIGESFTWINLMLALSHFGMAVEGAIYYPFRGISLWEMLLVAAILLFQDFMDYVIGLHPYLFNDMQYGFAFHGALILSGLIIGFLWYHNQILRVKMAKNQGF